MMQQRSTGAVYGPSFPGSASPGVRVGSTDRFWVGLLLVATSALSLAESPAAEAATAMPASTVFAL